MATLASVQILPDVPSIIGIDCDENIVPGQVEVTWTNPAGVTYDSIEVFVDGSLEATLAGSATDYSVVYAVGFTGPLGVCVRGIVGGFASLDDCCVVSIGGPDNDDCDGAIDIGSGTFDFDTTLAIPDEIFAVPPCTGPLGTLFVFLDVWHRFTATSSGDVTFSTCGSFDTTLLIFEDTGVCPPDFSAPISCDQDTCGLQEETTITVSAGEVYLIQIGANFNPVRLNGGAGTLVVSGAGL